jgi:hypothetical protein
MITRQFSHLDPMVLVFGLLIGGVLVSVCLVWIVAGRLRVRPVSDPKAAARRARVASFRSALEEIKDSLLDEVSLETSGASAEPRSDLLLRAQEFRKRGASSSDIAARLGLPLADARLLVRLSGLRSPAILNESDQQELNNGSIVAI